MGGSSGALMSEAQRAALAASTIVPRLARRWFARCRILSVEDLEGVGWVAATACASRFDAGLGVPFDGFARDYVHFAMQRAVSRERRALDEARGRIVDGGIDAIAATAGEWPDPGDPWADSEADAARQAAETADAVAATALLGAASIANARLDEMAHVERATWARAMALLSTCVATLPDDLRGVVTLHHLEGRTLGEVASALGMSEPTARRRHREALIVLMKRLRARGVEEAPRPVGETRDPVPP